MTTIVTNPVTLGAGVPDATTIETDLKFLIIQTITSTLTFQEAPLALVKSNLLAGALVAANNLSDLADDLVARSNLDARSFYYSSGTAAPSGTLGIANDIAINDNGVIYEKTAATTWTSRVDIATSAELTTAIANHVASSDPHPLYLTQTEGDVRYAPLGESPGSGARYLFDVSTAIGSIGTGEIRFNNTVSASITSIAIYETDRNGGAMATFLDLISIGSKLQVSFDASEEIYSWFNVTGITDNGAFRTFNVTHIASAGTRANGEVTLGIFGSAGSSLTVREVDGTPSVAASIIEFPNGSLTDQGGGVARLTFPGGGASGLQYTYNDADPPTDVGQIRTLQASLNVATAVAINAADVNGDSATDITARLKTGAIFTIAKDASNYVRLEATADYASGSVAVVVRSEQGTILTGETVYLDIISDSPGAVGPPGSVNAASSINFTHIATPASPSAGSTLIYAKSDGNIYKLNSTGGEQPIGSGASTTRELLAANRNYYVSPSGNNSNDGLSVGTAFQTIQKAIDVAAGLDASIYQVTINVGNSTYSENIEVKNPIGSKPLEIIGNISTPASVVITSTAGNTVSATNYNNLRLRGVKITAANAALLATSFSKIEFEAVDFGASAIHMIATQNSSITATGNYSISGGGTAHCYFISSGIITTNSRTVTITGTPNFSVAFAWSDRGFGNLDAFGMTFVGAATGKRYDIKLNSVIFTNGAGINYLPGNAAGTNTNGAEYF
jgi:hypothetical protein